MARHEVEWYGMARSETICFKMAWHGMALEDTGMVGHGIARLDLLDFVPTSSFAWSDHTISVTEEIIRENFSPKLCSKTMPLKRCLK